MTNQEILIKAIQKAVEGGCKSAGGLSMQGWLVAVRDYPDEVAFFQLIFNHDFAKALWGDNPKIWESNDSYLDNDDSSDNGFIWNWQYHLQQMVIADDPIKYLGEHLDG